MKDATGPHASLFKQVTETLNNTKWDELTFFESNAVHILSESVKPYILHNGSSWLVYNEATGVFEDDVHTVYLLAGRVSMVWLEGIAFKATAAEFGFLKTIDSNRGRRALMNGLSHKPGIYCKPDEFDTDPYMLNCQGEAYDLRCGSHRRAIPADRFTQSANYMPTEGQTPAWDKFLDDFTCGDAELKRYLLRFFGQALTGSMAQRQFLYMHGGGHNGKSKLLDIIGAIMGSYYGTANPELFSRQYNGGNKDSQYFYSLVGKRLVTCADVLNGTLNISAIKQITGGDGVTIKKLYADEVNNIHLKCKLIMSSQHKLRLTEFTDALSSRLRVIPCQQRIDEKKKDTRIVDKVLAEAPAVLGALIKEAGEFCRNDRELKCDAIDCASREYQKEQDDIGAFLDEVFEFRSTINRSELFNLYQEWGGKLRKGIFFIEVESRGYRLKKTNTGYVFETHEPKPVESDKKLSFPLNYPCTRIQEKVYENDKNLSLVPTVVDPQKSVDHIDSVDPVDRSSWSTGSTPKQGVEPTETAQEDGKTAGADAYTSLEQKSLWETEGVF
ncbi:hypothetical protein FACS189445_4710 [Spirochaetia bacterium]|nr:hypothetical protein FACS189445_4710 [Spirochaetia bacterium]